jgi:hypothetical protein
LEKSKQTKLLKPHNFHVSTAPRKLGIWGVSQGEKTGRAHHWPSTAASNEIEQAADGVSKLSGNLLCGENLNFYERHESEAGQQDDPIPNPPFLARHDAKGGKH